MKRTLKFLVLLCALVGSRELGAQIVRGTVEDSTGMPLNDVRVSLLAATSDSIIREVRTGNAGDFSINPSRGGRYRVRLNRIGYAQQTSLVMEVLPLQIVTLRFKMAVAAQQLGAVTVVERRNITLDEIMSASGFDIRENKYPMNTLNADQLAAEGVTELESLFWSNRFTGVEIVDDTLGHSLRMSEMAAGVRGYCFPEVYLDARQLSGTDGLTANNALMVLGHLTTDRLYGVEVYKGPQIPPPSLGGLFGSQFDGAQRSKPCGVVAVWTKAGREHALIAERARTEGSVQVVRGKVVDFLTGRPIPNATLILKSEFGADLEKPVVSDSTGTFAIRTKQYQKLRLGANASGYVDLQTPAFSVDLEEMLTVEVILSTDHRPLAPIALVSRELARLYSPTDSRGFSFRERRGLAGTFFEAPAIARSGARSLVDLLKGAPNVTVTGSAQGDAIEFKVPLPPAPSARGTPPAAPQSMTCKPMYFLNGELQRDPDTTVRPLQLSQVYGIELYPLANEVPFNYRMGSTGCGVLALWTKDIVKQ